MSDAIKVVLCLALHVQQLLTSLKSIKICLGGPLHDLQESYMAATKRLLASDGGPAGSLGGLERMNL